MEHTAFKGSSPRTPLPLPPKKFCFQKPQGGSCLLVEPMDYARSQSSVILGLLRGQWLIEKAHKETSGCWRCSVSWSHVCTCKIYHTVHFRLVLFYTPIRKSSDWSRRSKEKSSQVTLKILHVIQSGNCTPQYLPKWKLRSTRRCLSTFIYNCPKLEATKMSFRRRMGKQWYNYTMEYYSGLKRNELASHEKTWRKLRCK